MVLALLAALSLSQAFPPAGETVNIVSWEGGELPKVYVRSGQPPLTDDELAKLSRAGFDAPQLIKLLEERRCACDASADGLIRLKAAGVPKEVLAAVSLHALPPNRALNLVVTLDFASLEGAELAEPKQGWLFFFVDDGPLTRVFSVSLSQLLARRTAVKPDQTDPLVPRDVRRVQLSGAVPLKTNGPHQVLVALSANPALSHPSQLTAAEKAKAKTFSFDYPRASVQSVCRLFTAFKRDALLPSVWSHVDSRFECEWN